MVFRFALGRGGLVPRGFLGDYAGLLQTDGYAGYNHVGEVGMVHAGCWAHVRRYFIEALKVRPEDQLAAEFVRRIDELFAVDREARAGGLTLSERAELRREKSAKKVADIRERLRRSVIGCCRRVSWGRGWGMRWDSGRD